MSPILSPLTALRPGDIGLPVANLHAILARFDLAAIPVEETAPQQFGNGTARMVIRLFALADMQSNPDGVIDEDAAAKLNEFLVERGVLALAQGQVRDESGQPATGYRVRVHDRRNLDGAAAAEVETGERGAWRAFYDPRFYIEARPGVIVRTDEFVPVARAFAADGTEAARSEPTPSQHGRVSIDLVVRGERHPAPVPVPSQGTRRVRGWLEDRDGAKLVGFGVEVYDRDIGPLRPEQWRGRATTLEGGAFTIAYDVREVAAGDSAPVVADLVFRVTDNNGQPEPRLQVIRLPVDSDRSITTQLPVPESELALGIPAREDEYVRLVAMSAKAPAGESEFDVLMVALAPLLEGRSPAEMDEAANRDISFAARETGLDVERIADLVGAHRLVKGVLEGTPPAALYALMRTLELRDATVIAKRPLKDLIEALKYAIPLLIADPGVAVNALATDIHRRAALVALRIPAAEGGGSGIADALAAHMPDAGEQATLLQDFSSFDGSTPEFWRSWSASHPGKPVDAIQFSLQLAAATSGNVPLAAAIRAAHPQVQTLRALALELDAAKVAALIGATPAPELQPGESSEEGAKRIALSLSGLLDAAHPTAAVARLAAGWATDAASAVNSDTAALLRQIVLSTDYELGSGSLNELAQAHADVLFEGVDDPQVRAGALAGVGRIERLYSISSSGTALSAMATALGPGGKPFKGAFDIGALGKQAFLASFTGQSPEIIAELSSVHESAQLFAEASASLVLAALHETSDPSIAATRSLSAVKPIPNWAQLFGSERLNLCDECRSLGGPASYLVQILEFLDKRCPPNADGATPLDVLIGNAVKGIVGIRPDIAHIKLSCPNTDRTIPVIDFHNNIMESHMVFGSALATPPNDSSPDLSDEELVAAPEHIQAQAYEILAKTSFPISLPFDLPEAEARAFLEQVGTCCEEVIRLFQPKDADSLARERLRLTSPDHAIICATAAPDWPSPVLFGLPSAGVDPEVGWAVGLSTSLPAAAAVLGLSVSELLALCSTRFVCGPWSQVDWDLLTRMPLDIASFTALHASAFAAVPADVQDVLDWFGIPISELKALCDRNADRLPRTIVVDRPNHTQLDEMHLVHLDGTTLKEADWLCLHRMARLSRRSRIAIADLDLALTALGVDKLDAGTLQALGSLKAIAESLNLDWFELAALVGEAPAALWRRLFVASGVAKSDPIFLPDVEGRINPSPVAGIAGHATALAAAFDQQVADIIGLADALALSHVDNLSVTQLWRVIRLATALGVTVGEWVQLGTLTEQLVPNGPMAILELLQQVRTLKPVLGEALRFTGASPTAEDTTALQQAKNAVAKAVEGVEAGPGMRRATLESLSESFSVPPDALALLVKGQDPPDTGHVQRMSLLIGAMSLKLADLIVLTATQTLPPAGAAPRALLASFRRVQTYVAVADNRVPTALTLALSALASSVDAGWSDRVANTIAACRLPRRGESDAAAAAAVKAVADDVKAILTLPLPTAPTPAEDPIQTLAWIDARLAIAADARTPVRSLIDLAAGDVAALDDLKRGVQSRYEPVTWLQVLRSINDPLRQVRRDALLAFIKQMKGLDSDEAVFSELLLDPGMNSMVLTSPISNAMRTVQRFVHTVRLGLRSGDKRPAIERVDAAQINPEWDLYLHSFRMSQANFDVLAAPYLYMTPDLREDKTWMFKEAEAFLRQNDATPDNVEHAFLTYLEHLSEVANLEICGTYLQEDFAPDEAFRFKSVLHVFGRSRGGTKRSYYYRRLNRYEHAQEWTPWEPVKADIQAVERDRSSTRGKDSQDTGKPEAGVHLLPVVWRAKLHIFWPMFVRKIETSDEKPAINMHDGSTNAEVPQPYWEVKLCWSCLENGSWTPRQMSSDYHETFVLGPYHA